MPSRTTRSAAASPTPPKAEPAGREPATIRELLRTATARLTAAGVDSPRLDAELLLADVLDVGRARLVIDAHEPVGGSAARRFARLIARREQLEPVAYILGYRHFRRIALQVDRRVLIPRPETELLVEVGLGLPHSARVLDVGTGSGAVALALADERPDLDIAALDVSADALDVARHNAELLGFDVTFRESDLLSGFATAMDAVLANLPYVADDAELPADVGEWEPQTALFGGQDGLDLVRRLVTQVAERDAPVQLLALEIGLGQADAVAALLRTVGWPQVETIPDLAGIARVVVGRR